MWTKCCLVHQTLQDFKQFSMCSPTAGSIQTSTAVFYTISVETADSASVLEKAFVYICNPCNPVLTASALLRDILPTYLHYQCQCEIRTSNENEWQLSYFQHAVISSWTCAFLPLWKYLIIIINHQVWNDT